MNMMNWSRNWYVDNKQHNFAYNIVVYGHAKRICHYSAKICRQWCACAENRMVRPTGGRRCEYDVYFFWKSNFLNNGILNNPCQLWKYDLEKRKIIVKHKETCFSKKNCADILNPMVQKVYLGNSYVEKIKQNMKNKRRLRQHTP